MLKPIKLILNLIPAFLRLFFDGKSYLLKAIKFIFRFKWVKEVF